MKKSVVLSAMLAMATPAFSEPVDMTGLACNRTTNFGMQTWEFYGDAAIRYYGDGSVTRLLRVGTGAYEKYDKEGSWNATYLIFDDGDQLLVRLLARPGLLIREENPRAPMEKGVFLFNGSCETLWENG